jgi:hypothetical protein
MTFSAVSYGPTAISYHCAFAFARRPDASRFIGERGAPMGYRGGLGG